MTMLLDYGENDMRDLSTIIFKSEFRPETGAVFPVSYEKKILKDLDPLLIAAIAEYVLLFDSEIDTVFGENEKVISKYI